MELNSKDRELIERGTKALINELGYSGFLKYISRIHLCSKKYFRAEEEIYKSISADEKLKENKIG
ncbi:hypothetical protein M2651_01030 [Clostridium sp. SYSU_GA19001]|uniref:hypothetical protein n=1 Tax=Clostridium caldaquaticum TaxID=2940653 RepID=UPI0020776B86|nr:hypothetical protein [Clostridium caldaquaticum]MCM8709603.1 hypothetical protein [Clostridium caldaquaticum]